MEPTNRSHPIASILPHGTVCVCVCVLCVRMCIEIRTAVYVCAMCVHTVYVRAMCVHTHT